MVRLKDITGKAVSGEWGDDDISGNGVPVLRTTNFTMEGAIDFTKVVTRRVQKDVTEKLLRPGDILLEKSGGSDKQPVGRVVFYDGPEGIYLFNNFTALLRVQAPSRWNPKYVFYALQSNYERGGTRPYENRTTGIHNLKTEQYVADTVIPERPFAEQERITAALDTLNGLICLRKRQLAKLDELVKARFVELFGLPGTDLNGWGLTILGECCELNPRRPKDIATDTEYSFVAMPSVSENGHVDTSILRPYSEVRKGFTYFEENDVLFAKITPCMENGKGGIAIHLKNGVGFGSTEFHVLRPVEGKSNPYWLYAITSFKMFRINAAKAMTGSAGQRRVPLSYLQEYPIALPPLELQEVFAAFARQSGQAKLAIQRGVDKLETLRAALMREYFAPDNS